jgi:uncharacterized protein (DUF4415 family)
MKEELIGEISMNAESKTDWERLSRLSDEEIHASAMADPDALPTSEAFWNNARLVYPEAKETITIRLDKEMLMWFKSQGKGYQSRINAVLCAYMKATGKHNPQSS